MLQRAIFQIKSIRDFSLPFSFFLFFFFITTRHVRNVFPSFSSLPSFLTSSFCSSSCILTTCNPKGRDPALMNRMIGPPQQRQDTSLFPLVSRCVEWLSRKWLHSIQQRASSSLRILASHQPTHTDAQRIHFCVEDTTFIPVPKQDQIPTRTQCPLSRMLYFFLGLPNRIFSFLSFFFYPFPFQAIPIG